MMELLETRWGGVEWACSTNGAEEERAEVVGGRAGSKETTRMTKTYYPTTYDLVFLVASFPLASKID
jgi:hypothetical protein